MTKQANVAKVHLLSKSYPRAGHHYVANLLKDLYKERFYYCEFYQAPAEVCCRTEPCRNMLVQDERGQFRYRVSLQKSHDFDLTDPVRKTSASLKYLLFFRGFEAAIESRVKLFLIDHQSAFLGTLGIDSRRILQLHEKDLYRRALSAIDANPVEIPKERFDVYLFAAARHYVRFMQKWKAAAADPAAHVLSIHYETLMQCDLNAFLEKLVDFVGQEPVQPIEVVLQANRRMDANDRKLETSQQAQALMERYSGMVQHYVNQVRKEMTRLKLS